MIEKALCPGKDGIIQSRDLSDDDFRRLVAMRARVLDPNNRYEIGDKKTRIAQEEVIRNRQILGDRVLEKVNLEENFLPVKFLADGVQRSRAVCRIKVPTGRGVAYGTGFLVAPGIIMTNHHVIKTRTAAEETTAEFDYETGKTPITVAIRPNRLFITAEHLDFTIVGCDPDPVRHITPIQLRRNPAVITRNERLNIIQHPQARRKEVALHQNKVVRIRDHVVRYETDTEPGSSGSPVMDNDWNLVALHHAGWELTDDRAENEGIRISSIVAHLLAMVRSRTAAPEGLNEVLNTITDTSPYLGLFDTVGVEDADGVEVQIGEFNGTRQFADIGFWNIEHFNDSVNDDRINDIADVVQRLGLDVFGLTEVQSGALDRLVINMRGRGIELGYAYHDTPYSQDLAVLYDRDTSRVAVQTELYDRYKDLLEAKTRDGKTAFPRKPLFARCRIQDDETDPVEFMMIVVHLKAFGDATSRRRRALASEMLTKMIEDIREKENLPVVLGGDFNERLDNDTLRALKTSPDLFTMTADDASDSAISYVGGSHRSLIDHIVVTNDVNTGDISGDDAAIVRLDWSDMSFADRVSDHVPLVFRMVYREQATDFDQASMAWTDTIKIPEDASRIRLKFDKV